MLYAIHESIFEGVEKKLNRITRKCERYGNAFVFEVKGSEMREHKDAMGNVSYHRFVMVEVEGTAKVDDWEFIATLDVHTSGNVIRKYNTEIELPERFQNSDNTCDHCHTKRNRNNLYVIRNTVTGEFKQVGGNCLSLYTHGLSLEYVASWVDGITELESNSGVFSSNGKRYFDVRDVLHYAHIIIEKTGYLNANSILPTRRLVSEMLRNDIYASTLQQRVSLVNGELKGGRFEVRFETSDFCVDTCDVVDEIINYYETCENNNEFVHNIKIMLEDGYVPYNCLGYICYLPQGYAKHMERETKRMERMTEKHEHWGEVGKRYKNIAVKSVRKAAAFETTYGIMNVWNITLENDVVLTWKTSVYIEDGADNITFTVKAHNEYKGVKQTEVTRCKITRKAA